MSGAAVQPTVSPAATYALVDRRLAGGEVVLPGRGPAGPLPAPETLLQGRPSRDADPEAVREAAGMLESYFLTMLLREMRDSPLKLERPEDGYFAPSRGEELFTQQLDQAISDEIAHSGRFGLADVIIRQLLPGEP